MQAAGDFTVDLHTDVSDLVAVVGNLRALRPLLSTLYRPESRPLPDLSSRLWAARGGESMCSLLSRRRKRHRLLRLRQPLRYRNLELFILFYFQKEWHTWLVGAAVLQQESGGFVSEPGTGAGSSSSRCECELFASKAPFTLKFGGLSCVFFCLECGSIKQMTCLHWQAALCPVSLLRICWCSPAVITLRKCNIIQGNKQSRHRGSRCGGGQSCCLTTLVLHLHQTKRRGPKLLARAAQRLFRHLVQLQSVYHSFVHFSK